MQFEIHYCKIKGRAQVLSSVIIYERIYEECKTKEQWRGDRVGGSYVPQNCIRTTYGEKVHNRRRIGYIFQFIRKIVESINQVA